MIPVFFSKSIFLENKKLEFIFEFDVFVITKSCQINFNGINDVPKFPD